MAKRRHLSRIVVMQTVFENSSHKGDEQKMFLHNITEFGEENVDTGFAAILLKGVLTHWDDVLTAIKTHAPQWPIERMDPVSRAILMVGGFELLYNNDAPPPVIMDEAIEIAKEYGSPESAKFVNGVLNAISKSTDKKR